MSLNPSRRYDDHDAGSPQALSNQEKARRRPSCANCTHAPPTHQVRLHVPPNASTPRLLSLLLDRHRVSPHSPQPLLCFIPVRPEGVGAGWGWRCPLPDHSHPPRCADAQPVTPVWLSPPSAAAPCARLARCAARSDRLLPTGRTASPSSSSAYGPAEAAKPAWCPPSSAPLR